MKNILIFLITMLGIVYSGSKSDTNISNNFNKLFKFQKEINLDYNDNFLLAEITELELLGSPDNLVVLDRKASQAYIVNIIKRKVKKINLGIKFPGYLFKPFHIQIFDNYIWISSYTNTGELFKFNKRGKLVKGFELALKKYHFTNFLILSKSDLLLENSNPNGVIKFSIFNILEESAKVCNTIIPSFPNAVSRFQSGGLFIDNNFVYYTNAIENKIYRFDVGESIEQFVFSDHSNFNMIKKDIPANYDNLIKFLRKRKKNNFDIILNIYNLNDNLILINYLKEGQSFIELFNKSTQKTIKYLIKVPGKIIYCRNNILYLSYQKDIFNKSNKLVNPSILIYKFKR